MKKLVRFLVVLCLFITNLNAREAYQWEFMAIASSHYPYWENVYGKTVATKNHGGDIVQVIVDVMGHGDHTRVQIEYGTDMILLEKFDLINSSNIIVGTRYNFIKYNNTYSSALITAKHHSTTKAILGFN
ncbi:hypothetical protein CRU92_06310 [Arcobacter sp. FW59]|nr:hypothetical protein CRU92_06310 [Arcobacter sp. FW59]